MMDEKKIDERFMREAIRQARKAGALMEEDTTGEIRIKIRSPMRN